MEERFPGPVEITDPPMRTAAIPTRSKKPMAAIIFTMFHRVMSLWFLVKKSVKHTGEDDGFLKDGASDSITELMNLLSESLRNRKGNWKGYKLIDAASFFLFLI